MVNVTNKEIYNKLLEIEKQVIRTNGRVALNRWISSTALTFVVLCIGWMILT
ncbi:unnamed protein product [marine sediment metagenome]|uniref:Uncharacterized protein n=1 Tax=marine sediment metagenome TaxID=412755 RepID=X0TJA3_9ZZZZ